MLQRVKKRLTTLGYEETSAADDVALTFLIGKTDEHIINYCNIDEVPGAIKRAEVDAIVAEFLFTKSMSGKLDDMDIVTQKISSVTEGDASVSYDANGGVATLMDFYNTAKKALEIDMEPFRCMRW